MTKQLAQYSVPAENSRVIRVFLSSTFRDMEMERSALVKLFKGLQVKAASVVPPFHWLICVGESQKKMRKAARLLKYA